MDHDIQQEGISKADFHIGRAEMLMEVLRYEDARAQFAIAIAEEPDHPIAHCRMGVCLRLLQMMSEALEHGKTAVTLAPQNPLVLQNYAWLLFEARHHDGAKKVILEAIRIEPEFASAHALLAAIYIRLREHKSAIRSAEKALSLDPNHGDAHRLRGVASQKLGDVQEAEIHLRNSFRYDPENAFTHLAMGCARFMQDDFEPAEAHFRESLRIDPTFAPAQRMLLELQVASAKVSRLHLQLMDWFDAHSGFSFKALLILIVISVLILSRGDGSFGVMLIPLAAMPLVLLFSRMAIGPLATMSVALTTPEARTMTRWNYYGSMFVSVFLLVSVALAITAIALKDEWMVRVAIFLAYAYIPTSTAWECRGTIPRIGMVIATMLIIGFGVFCLYYSAQGSTGYGGMPLSGSEYNNRVALWASYCVASLLSILLPSRLKRSLAES